MLWIAGHSHPIICFKDASFCIGVFCIFFIPRDLFAAVPWVATGKNQHATILPVRYSCVYDTSMVECLGKWPGDVAYADTMLFDWDWLCGASLEVAFPHFWPATVFVCSQSPEEKGETEEGGDASKSEISLVYEIALKRNLSVNFEVRVKNNGRVTFKFTPPPSFNFLLKSWEIISTGHFRQTWLVTTTWKMF